MSDTRPYRESPPRRTDDEIYGARAARIRPKREGPWIVVERFKEDGAFDWFTWHLTQRGARRAASLYERTGTVKGIRP